jgi:hypothetical protein
MGVAPEPAGNGRKCPVNGIFYHCKKKDAIHSILASFSCSIVFWFGFGGFVCPERTQTQTHLISLITIITPPFSAGNLVVVCWQLSSCLLAT